ncbi:MAG TPA: ATP-binding protein [Myxococcota bacterium]|nr:ATP-binding protein [Myxococcota bacterium]
MSESSERLDAILGSLRVGILAVDEDGRVELQNPEASRILGLSGVSTLGRPLAETLGPQHPAVAVLEAALRDRREVAQHACSLRDRLGGRPLIVDLTASPVGVARETHGAVLSLSDRTIGRELEDLLGQRERSELFARLAAGIAHELRNPLGGIRGAAELLLGKLEDDNLARCAELIRAETERMRLLLDDLAQLTRGADVRPRRANLHRVIDDLVELHSRSESWRGVRVVREYDPSIPEFEFDPDRTTQVLLNLVRNAVQALAGKGSLVLRTRVESGYHLERVGPESARMVRIDVEDDGPGIPEEDLPLLFTPFFTRRTNGTGLGLAVAQHWTVRQGGRIQVTSRVGMGTRMRVELPIVRPA